MFSSRLPRLPWRRTFASGLFALLTALAAAFWPAAAAAGDDGGGHTSSIAQAVVLLASDRSTASLLDVLDENHVRIVVRPLRPGMFAEYDLGQHFIAVSRQWSHASPVALAAILAHEATHVSDTLDGRLTITDADSCVGSEIRAFRASAQFWTDYYGPEGEPDPQDEIERQMNLLAFREATNPEGLDTLIRETYRGQCNS